MGPKGRNRVWEGSSTDVAASREHYKAGPREIGSFEGWSTPRPAALGALENFTPTNLCFSSPRPGDGRDGRVGAGLDRAGQGGLADQDAGDVQPPAVYPQDP